jgi:hypothetical protein
MRRRTTPHFVTRVMAVATLGPSFSLIIALAMTSIICKTTPVWGANASPSPDFTDVPPVEAPPSLDHKQIEHSVDITPEPPAPPNAARKLGYFHKYRQGLSALIYGVYDTQVAANGNSPLTRASLLYLFNDESLRAYEGGADLLSDGTGALSIARRWIYSRTRFRPYTKAGVALRIVPSDQLTTVLKLENYQVRGAAGFEHVLRAPISLRFEIEATASIISVQGLVGLGLVWAW